VNKINFQQETKMQLTEYEQKSLFAFEKSVHEGKWSNGGLIELLRRIVLDYLRAKRVSNYASANNISPQGARRHRECFEIDGYQYIADND
jgi:hypothetical protein